MPDLTFSPSLPWPRGDSGTITLNNGNSVTAEQLLAGKLKFEVTINGEAVDTHVGQDASGNLHLEDEGDVFLYYLQIQQDGTVVTLTAERAGASITSVRLGTLRHAVEVFADEACTLLPTTGGLYPSLFVRLNIAFGFGDSCDYINEGQDNMVKVTTPSEGVPDDPYSINLYVNWFSEDFDSPFSAGQVIECFLMSQIIHFNFSTEFGPEVYV